MFTTQEVVADGRPVVVIGGGSQGRTARVVALGAFLRDLHQRIGVVIDLVATNAMKGDD